MFFLRVSSLLLLFVGMSDGFKILAICPSASYSHQQPFQALTKGLAARGHQVTVISPIPLKVRCKNLYKFLLTTDKIRVTQEIAN